MREFNIIVKTTTTEEITVELVEKKDRDCKSLFFEVGAIDDLFVLLHQCKKVIYSETKKEYGDYLDDIEDDYDEEFSDYNE